MTNELQTYIGAWRRKRRLRQKELAWKAGVSLAMIESIEAGRRGMSLETALAIARALSCTVDELVGVNPFADDQTPATADEARAAARIFERLALVIDRYPERLSALVQAVEQLAAPARSQETAGS